MISQRELERVLGVCEASNYTPLSERLSPCPGQEEAKPRAAHFERLQIGLNQLAEAHDDGCVIEVFLIQYIFNYLVFVKSLT